MKTCRQIAENWGISERSVNDMCKKGRIAGAVKTGKSWQIPDNAQKPSDGRVMSGKYMKKLPEKKLKALPTGISDYVRIQKEYYYTDKTLLIKEFLDRRPLVTLFTRPGSFGKTLNMDMLRVFFEMSPEDTGRYFTDKEIWSCGEEYRRHQGKYPVIFISFKDVIFDTWQETLEKLRGILRDEFGRHRELPESTKLAEYEKGYFEKVLREEVSEVEMTSALGELCRMLAEHFEQPPVVIIDDYDVPIREGLSKGFYHEIAGFMGNLFSCVFKDNKNIAFGFLTGILPAVQDGIFRGFNNLYIDSVMDSDFAPFFGFTGAEVKKLLQYYGQEDKESEIKERCGGYQSGETEIYNPRSVVNCIADGGNLQLCGPGMVKAGMIEDILASAQTETKEKLFSLLQGRTVPVIVNMNEVSPSWSEAPGNIWGLFLSEGLLTSRKRGAQCGGTFICEATVPNKETAEIFKNAIMSHLIKTGGLTGITADRIAESLYANDHITIQKAVSEFLEKSVRSWDNGAAGFCCGMLLGLTALLGNYYRITADRESGDGICDICFAPYESINPEIIIKLKWKKGLDADTLEDMAKKSLKQINDRQPDTGIPESGTRKVIKLAAAFSGRKVSIKTEQLQ
ncbi:MAG: AAA family ATPase [Parasporobacterium sp.]|nr:AAA family ATPase [Parasporobacterium sp.]